MRGVVRWGAAAVAGAAFAVLGVLATYWWWWWRGVGEADEQGFYSSSPLPGGTNQPRRYVDYLATGWSPTLAEWVRLLLPAAVAGALLGLVVLAVVVLIRRRATQPSAAT